MERIVRELLKQDPNTKIFISLDTLDKNDSRFELNMRCLERAKILRETGLIVDFQVADTPLGCYRGVVSGIDWFFERVPIGLILEEDLLVHRELVKVGVKLRETFNLDANLGSISFFSSETSSNNLEITKFVKSNFPSSWGWMTISEKWRGFIHEVDHSSLLFLSKGGITGYRRWKEVIRRINEGSLDSWAYRWMFTHWERGWYTLTPFPGGFIQNMGFDELATHTKSSPPRTPLGNLTTKWDLKNPNFIGDSINRDLDKLILRDRFGVRGVFDSIQGKTR